MNDVIYQQQMTSAGTHVYLDVKHQYLQANPINANNSIKYLKSEYKYIIEVFKLFNNQQYMHTVAINKVNVH